jgi:trimeric autotransporter adhesin
LWELFVGIGGNNGDTTKLYFTAGIPGGGAIQSHGLFGVLSVSTAAATAAPAVNNAGIVSSACYASCSGNGVAGGSIAAIFGTNLTDGSSCVHATGCDQTFDNQRRLRTNMAGAQVTVNGSPVPIFYATPLTLGIQVPPGLTGSTATVQVTVNGQVSNTQTLTLAPVSPGIFTTNFQGTGAGAFTHNDAAGTPVDAQNPARPGETIVLYMTGLGQTTPAVAVGLVPTATTNTTATPTVTIDGLPAQVQFAGLSGCCVGLNQINFVVPAAVHTNTTVNAVVAISGAQSNTVTLAVGAPVSGTSSEPPAADPPPAQATTPPPSSNQPATPPPPAPIDPYDPYGY